MICASNNLSGLHLIFAFFGSLQAVKCMPQKCLHAGSVVEEGLQWDIKVNSSDDIRTQRVNKSLAAMLILRSVHKTCSCMTIHDIKVTSAFFLILSANYQSILICKDV